MSNVQKISGVLAVFWMMFIFYLSHQPGEASSQLSSFVSAVFSLLPLPEEQLHYLVRKGAHVFASFLLAVLLYISSGRWYVAFLLSVIYAATDEFHQTFISGRSGQISDVGIDSIGVLLGLLFFQAFIKKRVQKLS
ncbi:VanZ family protein [Salimicrobium flavidum]|uniref:VanZ like family protein n=1 Tax=Salimicrobium flavidum TaxID=570947 RepID=A0A1N7IZX1_9BACI|nr:VanZ family protein [Salimicrobium flavidum]SIS42557.1 VanZ like family protein [Salimicrobium flavidum]